MSFFQGITRVLRAVSTRAIVLLGLLGLLVLSGSKKDEIQVDFKVPDVNIPKAWLKLDQNDGKWYYKGQAYNGYAFVCHGNGAFRELTGYINGKRQGPAFKWFEDGSLSSQKNYNANRLEGIAKTWWPNGVQSTASKYQNRQRHGTQIKWYANGQMAQRRSFNRGKEEGLQQAWLPTGKLYANYEAKNGRIFGLKKASLCYGLEDEKIQYGE